MNVHDHHRECHSERSEESHPATCGFFPFVPQGCGSRAQNDRLIPILMVKIHQASAIVYTVGVDKKVAEQGDFVVIDTVFVLV